MERGPDRTIQDKDISSVSDLSHRSHRLGNGTASTEYKIMQIQMDLKGHGAAGIIFQLG